MTHRALSKNSASSRAIPVAKIIQAVIDDPAMPVYWGAEQKGMQSGGVIEHQDHAINVWLQSRDHAVLMARQLVDLGVHKSLANRILEPWHHITVVVSATEWENFFSLRLHKDAQPEFQHLAQLMSQEYRINVPQQLQWGQWHLPFIHDEELADPQLDIKTLVKMSTARCARVSYLTHDKLEPKREDDILLHDRLLAGEPKHASPSEHPAIAHAGNWGNFKGFEQYRQMIPNNTSREFPWSTGVIGSDDRRETETGVSTGN